MKPISSSVLFIILGKCLLGLAVPLLDPETSALEDDSNYPTKNIEAAAAKASTSVKNFLRTNPDRKRKRRSADIDDFNESICGVISHEFRPRVARQAVEPGDSRAYNIVNLPEFVQRVQTLLCEEEGLNMGSGMEGVEHWCRQETVDVPLVAVVTGTQDVVIRMFQFPHGCTCYVK